MILLLRKEIRLLLPFWGIAMMLAIVPSWLVSVLIAPVNSGAVEIVYWGFGLGMILLGLAPFGQEFSLGTFSSMLAQPTERRRIWTTKIILISAAALLVLIAYLVANHLRLDFLLRADLQRLREYHTDWIHKSLAEAMAASGNWYADELSRSWKIGVLLLLIGISGGLWTSLLFRQTGAAFWFVILIPGALYVAVEMVCQSVSGHTLGLILAAVFTIYSAIGVVWARHMFAVAQDSEWLGETVSLLSLSPGKPREDIAVPRRKGVLRALVRKELQTHQISLLIGFGLLVLHICTLMFRRIETLNRNSELRFAIAAVPFLWLFVPGLIGCVAVAEERKLGTMESQLCLPVTRRFQFATKLAIALFLGIVLGGVMPSLLEWQGTRFHIASEIVGVTPDANSNYASLNPFDFRQYVDRGVLLMCLNSAIITLISFFASTLSRNTLHALGGAIVFGFSFFLLFEWLLNGVSSYEYFLWKGPLIFFIGVPVTVIAIIGLSFANYKRLHAGRNVWLRNLLILSAIMVFTGIATAFIDQRPWELAIPREPLHGPRRLTGPVRPAITVTPGVKIIALLPDGRLWMATQYRWEKSAEDRDSESLEIHRHRFEFPVPINGVFVAGSNWVAFAANGSGLNPDVVALRSDGTLWDTLSRTNGTNFKHWEDMLGQQPDLKRIGSDSDWKSLVSAQMAFFAVKTNGTLWGWGHNEDKQIGTNYGEFVREPVRIGDDSDWESLLADRNGVLFMKRDGSVWISVWAGANLGLKRVRIDSGGGEWLSVAGVQDSRILIRRDGSLWAHGFRTERLFGIKNPNWQRSQPGRIGDDSDWYEVSGFPPDLVAIKGGRLMKNNLSLFAGTIGQPSEYSDWLAADVYWDRLVALAADGTICMWRNIPPDRGFPQVLAPTHHPVWSLNIFADSKK
jgi:hypothetical protein